MEEIKLLRICLEATKHDLKIITVNIKDKAIIQKCEDYVKDQDREEDVCIDFKLHRNKPDYGIFYMDTNEIDNVSISDFYIILKNLVVFLNRNNISWEGTDFGFEIIKNIEGTHRFNIIPGFIIMGRNKFTLVYPNEGKVITHEFSFMDKL